MTKLRLFLAALVLLGGLTILMPQQAYASCTDSDEECRTGGTSNTLLHCRECPAYNPNTGKTVWATACRRAADSTPTDAELDRRATRLAFIKCNRQPRDPARPDDGALPVDGVRGGRP